MNLTSTGLKWLIRLFRQEDNPDLEDGLSEEERAGRERFLKIVRDRQECLLRGEPSPLEPYAGKWIIMCDGDAIFSGDTLDEAFDKAEADQNFDIENSVTFRVSSLEVLRHQRQQFREEHERSLQT